MWPEEVVQVSDTVEMKVYVFSEIRFNLNLVV